MLDNAVQCDMILLTMAKKKEFGKNKVWRATPEDQKLIQELKAKLGVNSESDIFRMGLRCLAQKELTQQ